MKKIQTAGRYWRFILSWESAPRAMRSETFPAIRLPKSGGRSNRSLRKTFDAPDERYAFRSGADRPVDLRRDRRVAYGGRAVGLLFPGPEGDEGGSDDRASL